MTITESQKKLIYAAYMQWSDQIFDDLEDKSVITAEELVYKVLSLTEQVIVEEEIK